MASTKLSLTLPALAAAALFLVPACGGDDDSAGPKAEAPDDGGSDGTPALFKRSACDAVPADDLQAAGFEPEPSSTLGEAGSSTGNACWWEGGLGGSRSASVAFVLSDLEADNFEQVATDEDVEVAGRSARRITGSDDLDSVDAYPACATRIEVETGVIVEVEVGVGTAEDYSTDDDVRQAEACEWLDKLLPVLESTILGRDGDQGDDSNAGSESGSKGATIPADADLTGELMCTVLAGSEIPAPGFDGVRGEPVDAQPGGASCKWSSGGEAGFIVVWYTFVDDVNADDPPLATDGREGSIVSLADAGECYARFRRGEGPSPSRWSAPTTSAGSPRTSPSSSPPASPSPRERRRR